MRRPALIVVIVAVAAALAASACANVEEDWRRAKGDDRAKGYEQFLSAHPNSPHEAEARAALAETVLIPWLAFVGNPSDMPSLERLKLSADVTAKGFAAVPRPLDFGMAGTIGGLFLNGRPIALASGRYDGNEIETKGFGKLQSVMVQGGMGRSGFTMLFYVGGTRAQRDAIVDYVEGKQDSR